MKTSKSLVVLSILTGLLAAIQSGVGLFYQAVGSPFTFTTLYGVTIQINGQGIYHFDPYFNAPINRGTDAVTLFLGVPLLAIAIWLYLRGSLRSHLFLIGVLSYFVYNSASVTLGVAYNNLFLEYIAYFSASLFSLGLAIISINFQGLAGKISSSLPKRGIAILLFIAGAAVLFAWLSDLIGWLKPGTVPGIASYTTAVTHAIDLAIISPLCFVTAILILRSKPASIVTASSLLILLAIIGIVVAVQTVFQLNSGIELTPGEIVGKAASFSILALFAIWMVARLFRSVTSLSIAVNN